MSKPKVFEEDVLQDWVQLCLADKVYPIRITIDINRDGKVLIEQHIDGRKLRGRFITWMAGEFHKCADIAPPANMTNQAFTKMWAAPMEALLRQAVYKGGVQYDKLKPKDKYNTLHAILFRDILKETITEQRSDGLTISSPQSIEKVGTSLVAKGNHYKVAVAKEARMLQSVET